MSYLSSRARQTILMLTALGIGLFTYKQPSQAQVTPDSTLGAEASTLSTSTVNNRDIQLIEGGASRGGNLFHSFSDFNVDTGEAIYFVTPSDIQNILSRVTGDNLSNINGLLGVDGSANLFLLNPNGILFGAEAQLDISGSFTAGAVGNITFIDGSTFDATAPEDSTLTVSTPLGLQLNALSQRPNQSPSQRELTGNLTNEATLIVGRGQTLTLAGDFVVSTVGVGSPEGVTHVIGNTVVLIDSDVTESAPDDSNSDRLFIQATGDILIGNSPDDELLFLNGTGQIFLEADADADGVGDVTMLSLQDTLVTQGQSIAISGENIIIGSVDASSSVDSFSFFPGSAESADGGDITLSSDAGDIKVIGNLRSQVSTGNGGTVTLSSNTGDISVIGEIGTDALSFGDTGDGGAVNISSLSGDITVNADVYTNTSSSFDRSGDAGDVTIVSESGDIELSGKLITITFSSAVPGEIAGQGKGGDVVVSSGSGSILLNQLEIGTGSVVGSGGSVNVSSASGDVTFSGDITSRSSRQESGQITFSSGSGAVETAGDIDSGSNSGNGGAITLKSDSGDVTIVGGIRSASSGGSVGDSGSGGTIAIISELGDIALSGTIDSFSFSQVGSSGSGGDVLIAAPNGSIQAASGTDSASIVASAIAQTGSAVAGGEVTLEAANTISDLNILTSSNGESGSIRIRGTEGDLTVRKLEITTSGQVEIPNPFRPEEIVVLDLSNFGQSGSALIEGSGNITLDAVEIQASADGAESAGDITVISPETVTFSNSQVDSNANSAGSAGAIRVEAARFVLTDGTILSASTAAQGAAGNIVFNLSERLLIDGSTVTSSTQPGSTGTGGNIILSAAEATLQNGSAIAVNSDGEAPGGNIVVEGDSLKLSRSRISAETRSSDGGNMTFNLRDLLLLRNNSLITTEAGTALAGGDGGDITINLAEGLAIAVPSENSDIRANAFEGNGGNVNITARSLLGIAFRPGLLDTPLSDITASSQFGSSGTVTITELDPDTLQTDTELPTDTAPPPLAQGCRTPGSRRGSFVSSGRGGLPTNPAAPLSDSVLWQDLSALDTREEAMSDVSMQFMEVSVDNEPVVEARSWRRDRNGTPVLIAQSEAGIARLPDTTTCH